jgi:hypothetical protein
VGAHPQVITVTVRLASQASDLQVPVQEAGLGMAVRMLDTILTEVAAAGQKALAVARPHMVATGTGGMLKQQLKHHDGLREDLQYRLCHLQYCIKGIARPARVAVGCPVCAFAGRRSTRMSSVVLDHPPAANSSPAAAGCVCRAGTIALLGGVAQHCLAAHQNHPLHPSKHTVLYARAVLGCWHRATHMLCPVLSKGGTVMDTWGQLQPLVPSVFPMVQLAHRCMQQPELPGPKCRSNRGTYMAALTQQLQLLLVGRARADRWGLCATAQAREQQQEQQQQAAVLRQHLSGPVRMEVRHIHCNVEV